MKLKICHLYPQILNLYGDTGNMLIIQKRTIWRGINTEITPVSLGDHTDFTQFDMIFIGGGADLDQTIVSADLQNKKDSLIDAVEKGITLLAICGGYQLLGQYYETLDGSILPGIGLFDFVSYSGKKRLNGNVVVELNQDLREHMKDAIGSKIRTLVGFENHSGCTVLGSEGQPLGYVLKGNGNNGDDSTEGACYKNAVGTYLHGPFLAQNPHFADYLIGQALRSKYSLTLTELDNSLELQAHHSMVRRLIRHYPCL